MTSPSSPRDPILQAFEAGRAACITALKRAIATTTGPPRLLPLAADECVTILESADLYGSVPDAPSSPSPRSSLSCSVCERRFFEHTDDEVVACDRTRALIERQQEEIAALTADASAARPVSEQWVADLTSVWRGLEFDAVEASRDQRIAAITATRAALNRLLFILQRAAPSAIHLGTIDTLPSPPSSPRAGEPETPT